MDIQILNTLSGELTKAAQKMAQCDEDSYYADSGCNAISIYHIGIERKGGVFILFTQSWIGGTTMTDRADHIFAGIEEVTVESVTSFLLGELHNSENWYSTHYLKLWLSEDRESQDQAFRLGVMSVNTRIILNQMVQLNRNNDRSRTVVNGLISCDSTITLIPHGINGGRIHVVTSIHDFTDAEGGVQVVTRTSNMRELDVYSLNSPNLIPLILNIVEV